MNPANPLRPHEVHCVETGAYASATIGSDYVGTVVFEGGYVLHVFTKKEVTDR